MIFIGILGFEAYVDRSNQEAMVSVIQFKSTLEKGSPINKEDVSFHSLPESYYHSGMTKEDHFKEGMFLNTRVYKGGFLLNEQVQEEQIFELAEDERLITVKCSIVQSNAWQSQLFDRVDLLMVQKKQVTPLKMLWFISAIINNWIRMVCRNIMFLSLKLKMLIFIMNI